MKAEVAFMLGMAFMSVIWLLFASTLGRKPEVKPLEVKSAKPEPKAEVKKEGDVLLHRPSGLPVLLKKQLSHDLFEACFLTPHCSALGATFNKGKPDQFSVKPLEIFFAKNVTQGWVLYPHELSDQESANFAKAMLADKDDQK